MPERPSPEDPNAKLVDALLKKLPHADPKPGSTPGPGGAGGPARRAAVTRQPQVGRGKPDRPGAGAVWTRVGLGLVLAAAITQWPYATDCGWALTGYSTAVIVVLATAGWASVFSWRGQLGVAHVIALGTLTFGIGLAASVVLPRVGYARNAATWRCGAQSSAETTTPADAPGVVPGTPAIPADSLAPADSLTPGDSLAPGDSLTPPDSGVASSAAPDSGPPGPTPPPDRDR